MSGELRNTYALLREPGVLDFCVEPLPPDLPRPDYVRMQVAYCGLCGSDLAFYRGRPGANYPRTLGHEHCGTIVAVGSEVSHLKVGARVVVDPNYRCQQCLYCQTGRSHLCEFSEVNFFSPRGFAKYVDIHASYVYRLPSLNPPSLGGLVEPLSCALHALELAAPKPEDRLLILGAGSQGSMLALGLSVLAPESAYDVYDPNHLRAANLASGFQQARPLKTPPRDDHYTLVFEVSGVSLGFQIAAQSLHKSGRVVISSRYADSHTVCLPFDFPRKEATLLFSHLNGSGELFRRALELVEQNWSPRYNRILSIHPLRDLEEVLKNYDQSPFCKTVIEIGGQHGS